MVAQTVEAERNALMCSKINSTGGARGSNDGIKKCLSSI